MAISGLMVVREFNRLTAIEKELDEKLARTRTWSDKWWSLLDQLDLVVTQRKWLGSLKLAGFQRPNTPPQLKDWSLLVDSPREEAPVFLRNSEKKS